MNTVSLVRITKQLLQPSTGQRISANTRIGLPIQLIHTSYRTLLYSPATGVEDYVPPAKFDGFRYEKLRKLPGNDSKYQYVAASNEALGFSLGTHCFPGRFYLPTQLRSSRQFLQRLCAAGTCESLERAPSGRADHDRPFESMTSPSLQIPTPR